MIRAISIRNSGFWIWRLNTSWGRFSLFFHNFLPCLILGNFGFDSFFSSISGTRKSDFRLPNSSLYQCNYINLHFFHILDHLWRQLVQKIQAAVTDDISSVSVIWSSPPFKKKWLKDWSSIKRDQFWTPCQISVMIENVDNCVTKKF